MDDKVEMDDNESISSSEACESSVPMPVTEIVEEIILKLRIFKKNYIQKQINAMKKKLENEKEQCTMLKKNKVEHLIKFRQLTENGAKTNKGKCKNCPSLEWELLTVKERISGLLDEQIEASEKVFQTEQAVKVNQAHEEKKLHEIKELEEQIEKRKADTNKHFRTTKFNAKCLRQQIEMDLESTATADVILAIQKKVTDLALEKAYDEIPKKIAIFEKETKEQAWKEVKEEIDAVDKGLQYPFENYDEENLTQRREQYMKWLYRD